jgi:hypothetical protein
MPFNTLSLSHAFLSWGGLVVCASLAGCLENDTQTPMPASFGLSVAHSKAPTTRPHDCDTTRLTTPLAHQTCLKAIAEKAKKLSDDFYFKAHQAMGLNPDVTDRKLLAEAWRKHYPNPTPEQAQIIRTLGNFEHPCSGVLAETIRDPAAPLRFSHTTGYGAARYCLQSAMTISKQTGINFDSQSANDVLDAIDTLYDHYDKNPIGDGNPAYGSQNPF